MSKRNTLLSDKKRPFGVNQEAKEKLDVYLAEEKITGAFLIKGEWGTGKTYFFHQYKESCVESMRDRFLYVSLNGVSSTDEIDTLLFEAAHPRIAGFQKSKITRLGFKVFKGIASIVRPSFSETLTAGESSSTKGATIDASKASDDESFAHIIFDKVPDNAILVFDDIERCYMDVRKIYGYISQFIEQDGLKVILIANEKEINEQLFEPTRHLAEIKQSIDALTESKKQMNAAPQQNLFGKDKSKPVVLPLLPLYSRMREKTIADEAEISFDPEVGIAFLLDAKPPDYISSSRFKDIAKDAIGNCHNFRDCFFAAKTLSRFISKLSQSDFLSNFQEGERAGLLDTIAKQMFQYAFRYRQAKDISDGPKAIVDFIRGGAFPKKAIKSFFDDTLDGLKNSHMTENCWDFTSSVALTFDSDDEYLVCKEKAWSDFVAGKIGTKYWEQLIGEMWDSNHWLGFSTPSDEDIAKAVEGILKNKFAGKTCQARFREVGNVNPKEKSELYRKIRSIIEAHNDSVLKKMSKEIVPSNYETSWQDAELIEAQAKKARSFLADHYSQVELYGVLERWSNRQLYNFYHAIQRVYGSSDPDYYQADQQLAALAIKRIDELMILAKQKIRKQNLELIRRVLVKQVNVDDSQNGNGSTAKNEVK